MPVTHDILYGSLAASSSLDLRPPIDEVWQLTRHEQDTLEGSDPRYVDAAGNLCDIVDSATDTGAYTMAGPVWFGNNTWIRIANTDVGSNHPYAAYLLKYKTAEVSVRVTSVVIANGSTASQEVRPPVGTDWLVKMMLGSAAARFILKNATSESINTSEMTINLYHAIAPSVGATGANSKYGAAVTVLLTNSFWMKLMNLVSPTATCMVVVVYVELPAGTVQQVSGIANVGASGTYDVRAPAGEVWTIGAWCSQAAGRLYPTDGATVRSDVNNLAWPKLKANLPVGNVKWARYTNGSSALNFGFVGSKHPMT